MKKYLLILLSFLFINNVKANNMGKIQVFRNGDIPSTIGSGETFSGGVVVNSKLPNNHESNVLLGEVKFNPDSRTAWHTHDWGQLLIITEGVGEVQEEGKEIIEVKAGDVVWFPAGVKHWHGAKKDHTMSHIYIVAETNTKNPANWLEKVEK